MNLKLLFVFFFSNNAFKRIIYEYTTFNGLFHHQCCPHLFRPYMVSGLKPQCTTSTTSNAISGHLEQYGSVIRCAVVSTSVLVS